MVDPRRKLRLVVPALAALAAVVLFFLPLEEQTLLFFDFSRFWTFDYMLFAAFVLGLPLLLMPHDGRGQRPVLVFFLVAYVGVVLTHLPAIEGDESKTWILAVGLILALLLIIAVSLVRAKTEKARVALPALAGLALISVLVLFGLTGEDKLGESFSELSDEAGAMTLFAALFLLLLFTVFAATRWSRGIRVAVILFALAYFGFLQAACPRLPGAIELTLLHLSEPERVGMHVIKIVLMLVMGLIFGRYYCGWICPKGIIQELIYRPKLQVKVPEKVDRVLKWGKYLMLALLLLFPLIWEARLFRHIGPFRVIFNLSGPAFALILLLVVLTTSVFINRAYCRYFCPEGGLLALAQLVSPYRVRLSLDSCTSCGRCYKTCPVDAFVVEEKKPVAISRTECIVCKECEHACREGVIYYGPEVSGTPFQTLPTTESPKT